MVRLVGISSRLPRKWTQTVVRSLVDSMIASQILWSDQGILSFAPEGEAKYGRKNFMELLSVFTSPPLFQVMCGRKELGFVHESTFFNKQQQAVSPAARRSILEDDPSGLAASNRPCRAIGPEGQITVAGSGAVPQLRGLSIHQGDSGK